MLRGPPVQSSLASNIKMSFADKYVVILTQSFAERMNSRGKLIVTENRTCLKHSTLEKLVVLKMNKMSIKHCRQKKALQIIKMGEQNGM